MCAHTVVIVDTVDGGVGRGIGLRFPRFLRIREDKNSNSATLSDQIVDMYQGQTHINGKSIVNCALYC